MEELRVQSWIELQELLFSESWNEALGRYRSDFAFRGRWDASESLVTRLTRLGGDSATLERHLRAGLPVTLGGPVLRTTRARG
jgi:hypothetical protein